MYANFVQISAIFTSQYGTVIPRKTSVVQLVSRAALQRHDYRLPSLPTSLYCRPITRQTQRLTIDSLVIEALLMDLTQLGLNMVSRSRPRLHT